MITYIELWKAKQSWIDLSKEERAGYMNAMAPAIQQLLQNGVEIVSWGTNDEATFSRFDYDYFAVWTFPDKEAAQGFEKMVEGSGWYNYFEQVNVMGTAATPPDVIGNMVALSSTADSLVH